MNRASSIIVISYHYDDVAVGRTNFWRRALVSIPSGANVTTVASDFDHIRKQTLTSMCSNVVRLPVRRYDKNISFARVLSYWDFACCILRGSVLEHASVLVVCVPDYISALAVLLWSRRFSCAVLIDVVDLWPEALPLPVKWNLLFKGTLGPIIARVRACLFAPSSLIFFQSEYFIGLYGSPSPKHRLLRMCCDPLALEPIRLAPPLGEKLCLVFLGSINSVTDTESIVGLLRGLAAFRKIRLALIGGGNSLFRLQEELRSIAVETVYYGINFDPDIKSTELAGAHFGLNLYRSTTAVAVSYKSMEYLQYGLPLLNSAQGDTSLLVEREGCGFNCNASAIDSTITSLISLTDEGHAELRANATRVFNTYFSFASFEKTVHDALSCLQVATEVRADYSSSKGTIL
jgi:glycosyltransferase involved in cell wall biosynthesis